MATRQQHHAEANYRDQSPEVAFGWLHSILPPVPWSNMHKPRLIGLLMVPLKKKKNSNFQPPLRLVTSVGSKVMRC